MVLQFGKVAVPNHLAIVYAISCLKLSTCIASYRFCLGFMHLKKKSSNFILDIKTTFTSNLPLAHIIYEKVVQVFF